MVGKAGLTIILLSARMQFKEMKFSTVQFLLKRRARFLFYLKNFKKISDI